MSFLGPPVYFSLKCQRFRCFLLLFFFFCGDIHVYVHAANNKNRGGGRAVQRTFFWLRRRVVYHCFNVWCLSGGILMLKHDLYWTFFARTSAPQTPVKQSGNASLEHCPTLPELKSTVAARDWPLTRVSVHWSHRAEVFPMPCSTFTATATSSPRVRLTHAAMFCWVSDVCLWTWVCLAS